MVWRFVVSLNCITAMNFVNIDSANINHFKSKEFASVMEFLNDGRENLNNCTLCGYKKLTDHNSKQHLEKSSAHGPLRHFLMLFPYMEYSWSFTTKNTFFTIHTSFHFFPFSEQFSRFLPFFLIWLVITFFLHNFFLLDFKIILFISSVFIVKKCC